MPLLLFYADAADTPDYCCFAADAAICHAFDAAMMRDFMRVIFAAMMPAAFHTCCCLSMLLAAPCRCFRCVMY